MRQFRGVLSPRAFRSRSALSPGYAIAALQLIAWGITGCGTSVPECERGSEGCSCVESKCLQGLECLSDVCVDASRLGANPASQAQADGGPASDAVAQPQAAVTRDDREAPAPVEAIHGAPSLDDVAGVAALLVPGETYTVASTGGAEAAYAEATEHDPARRDGKRVPQVRQAKAEVKGALDKDIIRRIVRSHINEITYCYKQGLARDPDLKGRVTIQFTISPTGSVPVAVVQDTDLKNRAVADCMATAAKRWKFPKPRGGGNVVVSYPFVLSPG
jgi:outer membrane biosynthesis protein TonB